MANSEWTQEERERAKEIVYAAITAIDDPHHPDVCDCDLVGGDDTCKLQPPATSGYEKMTMVAIELQCSLNRLQAEVREARELLQLAGEPEATLRIRIKWVVDHIAWLSRNK